MKKIRDFLPEECVLEIERLCAEGEKTVRPGICGARYQEGARWVAFNIKKYLNTETTTELKGVYPKKHIAHDGNIYTHCGKCHKKIQPEFETVQGFCMSCGTKIDWSDEE